MVSILLSLDGSLKTFFNQFTEAVGFGGYLGICIAVEVLFVLLFSIKTFYSYEYRLKRKLDQANAWIFNNKKLHPDNIKEFNDLLKAGPKRFAYYWQQFILNREGGPTRYMTVENIIEKPLRTSSWKNNVRNLGILTAVWSVISFILGLASQANQTLSFQAFAVALVIPSITLIVGIIAIIVIKGLRVLNLDDLYHLFHIFSRFVTNACDELPPYIDFNLLYTPEEIEKGNAQIREYYEAMARKAKEEFEEAKRKEAKEMDYNFRGVGVDGALLLERAMKESEEYINTKNATFTKIAQIEAQKEAIKRDYDEAQMELQRKMQATKESISKSIEQQRNSSNQFERVRLVQQQEKDVQKLNDFQADYDQAEAKYKAQKDDLDKEIENLSHGLVVSLNEAENGMTAEYQTFFKKVMKSAYSVADNKVKEEKRALEEERDQTEQELINVQTQIKRLLDENVTLRARLEELTKTNLVDNVTKMGGNAEDNTESYLEGKYDEVGNFVYEDGSFHDPEGLFHDANGNVYDLNGNLIQEQDEREESQIREEDLINEQIDSFGSIVADQIEENVADQDLAEVEKLLQGEDETEKRGKGRPKKVKDETEDAEPKKKGRPRKEGSEEVVDSSPKKRGRPRKEDIEAEINNINQLISAEEDKVNQLRKQFDSNIDHALEDVIEVEREKQELIDAVEALKNQAESMKYKDNAGEEMAKINKRIEDLINNISSVNNN